MTARARLTGFRNDNPCGAHAAFQVFNEPAHFFRGACHLAPAEQQMETAPLQFCSLKEKSPVRQDYNSFDRRLPTLTILKRRYYQEPIFASSLALGCCMKSLLSLLLPFLLIIAGLAGCGSSVRVSGIINGGNGSFVFVANNNTNSISIFQLDKVNGQLTSMGSM